MSIAISIDKYSVTPKVINLGTRNTIGIETLEFHFSEEWSGLTKRITFYACEKKLSSPFILPVDDVFPLPPQATVASGYHLAVLDGCGDDGTVIYSQKIPCIVEYHPEAGTQPPPEYTPDEYHQFVALIHEDKESALAAAEQSKNDAERAEEARSSAEDAAEKYPEIREGTWWIFDPLQNIYINTGVPASGSGNQLKEATNEDIDDIFNELQMQTRRL